MGGVVIVCRSRSLMQNLSKIDYDWNSLSHATTFVARSRAHLSIVDARRLKNEGENNAQAGSLHYFAYDGRTFYKARCDTKSAGPLSYRWSSNRAHRTIRGTCLLKKMLAA